MTPKLDAIRGSTMSIEKLREELTEMVDSGLKNMHVSWAMEAVQREDGSIDLDLADSVKKMTPNERAAAVSEMLAECRKWNATSDEDKMRIQIKQSYESLKKVIGQCQFSVDEYMREPSKEAMQDLHSRLSKVFGGIEGALMLLGNWVRNEDRIAIAKEARESKGRSSED